MPISKIFCPNCGHGTSVDNSKDFFFCPQCGNKVLLTKVQEKEMNTTDRQAPIKTKPTSDTSILEEKLKEVEFYYKLSVDKKEYKKFDSEPTYYLKAQDLLVDLSEQYPDDYRIWWELSKPVDYPSPSFAPDVCNQYKINEDYFNKALDKAAIPEKKQLIQQYDVYCNNKEAVKKREEQHLQELEKQNRAKELEEKRRLEEKQQAELKRQKEEEENLKKQKEQELLAKTEQEKAIASEHAENLKISENLWTALNSQNYSAIDNMYFSLPQNNNQNIIATFKAMSNILYLNTFRIDGNKGNAVYKEQSMAIQFDANGYGIKFNKSPIKIKGLLPPNNLFRITLNAANEMFINNILLKSDAEYIHSIMNTAKKTLFSSAKIFE